MKKLILLIALLFIPFVVNAEECDTSNVYIDSATEVQANNITELDDVFIKDKNVGFALNITDVGDSIKYKIILKNDSNEDYELDKKSIESKSSYLEYTLESNDNSYIIKANSSKTVYLNIQYKNEVPEYLFNGNSYIDESMMRVNLSNDIKSTILNPKTSASIFIITALLLSMVIALIVLKKHKRIKAMIIIIGLIIIPISVNALCKCEIYVYTESKINKKPLTGTIYRTGKEILNVGDSIVPKYRYILIKKNDPTFQHRIFDTYSECAIAQQNESTANSTSMNDYMCSSSLISGTTSYTRSTNDIGSNYYIKNEVVKNIVTKAQVCFVTNKEVCLNPNNSEDYEQNFTLLQNERSWFESKGGSCTFSETAISECTVPGYYKVKVDRTHGTVEVEDITGSGCDPISCFSAIA